MSRLPTESSIGGWQLVVQAPAVEADLCAWSSASGGLPCFARWSSARGGALPASSAAIKSESAFHPHSSTAGRPRRRRRTLRRPQGGSIGSRLPPLIGELSGGVIRIPSSEHQLGPLPPHLGPPAAASQTAHAGSLLEWSEPVIRAPDGLMPLHFRADGITRAPGRALRQQAGARFAILRLTQPTRGSHVRRRRAAAHRSRRL